MSIRKPTTSLPRSLPSPVDRNLTGAPRSFSSWDAPAPSAPAAPGARKPVAKRRYHVYHLDQTGELNDFTKLAPAHPLFESSFAAMARGSLLTTDRGQTAIEDILPGDRVLTATRGLQPVLWRGSITLSPLSAGIAHTGPTRLTRILADTFGPAMPSNDLLLGPAARLFMRSKALQKISGTSAAFVPARHFIDGTNVFEVSPPSPVEVFQLGFARHERLHVNGIELESHNPGHRTARGLEGAALKMYLDLFPHVSALADFGGPLHPRLPFKGPHLGDVA